MDRLVVRCRLCNDLVDESVTTVEYVQDRVGEISTGIGEISDPVEDQAENTDQIATATETATSSAAHVANLAQEITTKVQRQSEAVTNVLGMASSLNDLSEDVHRVIDMFDLEAVSSVGKSD